MSTKRALPAALAVLCATAGAGEVWRCPSPDGVPTFQDTACDGAAMTPGLSVVGSVDPHNELVEKFDAQTRAGLIARWRSAAASERFEARTRARERSIGQWQRWQAAGAYRSGGWTRGGWGGMDVHGGRRGGRSVHASRPGRGRR